MGAREATYKLRETVATLCKQGRLKDALNLLHRPVASPDYLTFTSLIHSCMRARALPEAKLVHRYLLPILPSYPANTRTIAHNHLIRMYDQCGAPLCALRVFESMPSRNRVTYNVMLAAHARAGHVSQAFQLLIDMHLYNIGVDKFSFISIVSACVKSSWLYEDDASRTLHMMPTRSAVSWNAIVAVYFQYGHVAKLDEGKKVHVLIQASGRKLNVVLGTALVDMYSKCGDFDAALKVFRDIRAGNVDCRKTEASNSIFHTLLETSSNVHNLADRKPLDACSHVDNLDGADNTLLYPFLSSNNGCQSWEDVIDETCITDTVSWNGLISANSQHGNSYKALDLFWQMLLKGVKPTENTFISVLSACSHTGLANSKRQRSLLTRCLSSQGF